MPDPCERPFSYICIHILRQSTSFYVMLRYLTFVYVNFVRFQVILCYVYDVFITIKFTLFDVVYILLHYIALFQLNSSKIGAHNN